METFQITSGVQLVGNESPNLCNVFIDYALYIYECRGEETANNHLNIPFLIDCMLIFPMSKD